MEPLPSQSNMSISHPSIFVNQDDSSISIFAEACSIKGRPKLMRTLRNFGASLCSDPKSAQIILVDQETVDGKIFIRNWGRDKVVLHYTWAKKSIQAGKALLKDCNWGECLTVDDGLLIETEDADEPELNHPLPTPRITPESKVTGPPSPGALSKPPPDVPIPSQNPISTNDIAVTGAVPNLPQTMPSIPSMSINATDPFPQTPYNMQMPNMSSMPPQMTPMMMAQYMMMMMNPSNNYLYNPQAQQLTDFNSALIDTLRIHNVPLPNFQPPSQGSPLQSNMHDNQTLSQLSTNQDYIYPDPSSSLLPISDSQSTSVEAPVRKKRRASTTFSDSLSMQGLSKKKIKSKAIPPEPKHLKPGPSATQSSEKKLFHSKSGKELSFFVQVEMHNRSGVVAAIKKHGGKIEGNNEIADYAILASGATKSKTFKDLLLSTVAAGRPALSARFVHESVAQNTLLDPRDYAFDSPPTIKARKRTATQDADELERRRLAKNARESARRQRLRGEAAELSTPPKKKNAINKNTDISLPAHSGPPSPTPPLQHTREMAGGSFKFTDSEREYAIKYAEILFARDHEISNSAVGAALHKKMPNHTANSWRTYITTPSVRDEFERIRKRAGIVYRKAQEQKQSQATQSAPEDKSESESEDPIVTPITPSPTLVDEPDTDKKVAEEDDLNIVAKFFAGNEDDSESESVIWARLDSQATCKTASSWEEFYNMHHEEVVKRYEILCASQ